MGAPDRQIAGYRSLRSLGRGSFGEVFEAEREGSAGLAKNVALKLLSPELAADPRIAEAFVRGGELASSLAHGNVVQVLDVGRDADEGSPFIVTELASGLSLSVLVEQLRQSGTPVPPGLAVLVASEIAKALDHAHRRSDLDGRRLGIVHGDLTPSNVLLTPEGRVAVLDFCVGDALFLLDSESPRLAGKWAYAAPERARKERLTAAADLFSVGVLAFELLTGQNPFERPGGMQARRALATLERAPDLAELAPDVPEELAKIVQSLLAPHPAARIASAARLHESLMRFDYASGARFGAAELGRMVSDALAPREPHVPRLGKLLATIGEGSAPEIEVRYEVLDKSESIPPPLNADASTQDATLLIFALEQPAPEDVLALIASTLRRYGGRVLELSPREVSAVFGLDFPDGRDTDSAARSALLLLRKLQHTGLGVSCGLSAARLRVTQDGAPASGAAFEASLGEARALAGRRGWVVVDRRSARELRRAFDLEPLGESGRAWAIEEPRAEPPGEFVGRRTLLAQLGELLERAQRGRLTVLGLVGAPGVGKTRLLGELVRRLRASNTNVGFALASCPPRGRNAPLSALDAMLHALSGTREGDSLARIQPVERQLRALGLNEVQTASVLARLGTAASSSSPAGLAPLGRVLTQMFASLARERLHLFAWDDAHELDAASAELVASILEPLSGTKVVLLFAARPDETAAYRALSGYTEIRLAELDEREARRLVAARLGVDRVPDRLFSFFHERAGGHPMFLEELVHEAVENGEVVVSHRFVQRAELETRAIPRTLRSTLADRVRRLPDELRRLLVSAAVLGAPVDVAVLAQMTDASVGAVNTLAEALEERELIRRDGYLAATFPSPLLPEVVLADLDADVLAGLHRSAADAYLAAFEDTEAVAHRIADHLEHAGDARAAGRYFAKCGLGSLRSGRLDRAVRELARSITLDFGAIEAGDLVLRVSALAQAVARCPERHGVLAAVELVERELGGVAGLDERTRANVLHDLGKILACCDREQHARRVLTRVVELCEPWPELCRAAITSAAEIALARGDFAEALELSERASRLEAGGVREQHRLLLTQAKALASSDRHEEAFAALDRAGALVPAEDAALASERARTRAIICAFRGDWQGCADASEEAAEHGRSAGLTRELAANLHNQGEALIRVGDLARGYAALHASLAVAEESGADRIANFDRLYLAYLDALDGLPGADEVLSACMAHALERGWMLDQLTGRYLLGKLLAKRGELDAACRELRSVRTRAIELANRPLARDCSFELELLEPTLHEG